jgi:two-component system, chemotaxis family, chemotaxis protein CheY
MARVLVADDAAIVRKIVGEMLESGGHTVVGEAATGEDAVRLFAELRPDVSVLDVNMPAGDGMAAAQEIRAIDVRARLIIASVLATRARVQHTVELDAAFLAKPFESEALLRAVEQVLGGAA